jgi:hypothetical protein
MRKMWILGIGILISLLLGNFQLAWADYPRQNGPRAGMIVYTKRINLCWERGPTPATEYQIQLSRERGFSSIIFDRVVPNSEYFVTVDVYTDGIYYWRIRGKEGDRWGSWKDTYFQVDSSLPPHPTPQEPNYGDVVLALYMGHYYMQFRWSCISGTIDYELDVSDKSNFSSIVYEQTGRGVGSCCIDVDFPNLTGAGEYYWRVKVMRESGWSDWSTPTWFILFHKVKLNNPADAFIERALGAIFQWDPVPGASEYEVQWSTARDFSIASSQITSRTNFSTPAVLTNETTYYWRVKERGAPWTGKEEVRSFTISIIPTMPFITEPAQGSKIFNQKPTFKWEHVAYATSYKLEVRVGSSSGRLAFEASPPAPRLLVTPALGTAIVSFNSPVNLAPGKYVSRIMACNRRNECSGWRLGEFEVVTMRPSPIIPKKSILPKGRP